ncbi:DUF5017 domain-containing protein [Parapedobacter sp. SGR-10]|uniref:DUF5017 domain-containing protein n=1 Tax=Parapedobacter sp. SGR-10 TaxID=2710879 RepID=UPI0013D29E4A|nr:DUF5017 domain-containing protein [Parapedobacter sp. SGR-10]NGF55216.1 DUF5017 domain-containing protein [Parapedobacter sp. SGR-10]
MSILKKLLAIAIVLSTFSCTRDELLDPVVDVSIDKEVYSTEDSVEFHFSGYADMITFYSGEKGKEYKNRNRLELEGGDLILNMETQVLYGSQTDNLKLYLSTDFTGEYTKEGVEKATWTDISDRLTWCVAAGGAVGVRTISDYASVSDLLVSGKPVYFAFRYVGEKPPSTTPTQRTWRIYQFNIQNKFSETEIIPVTDRVNAGWTSVSISNPGGKGVWFLTHADMIYYNPESNLEAVEKWVITKRFDPNKVAPDNGKAIKKYPDNQMSSFKYNFPESGEYEVTFVFVNSNYKGIKESVKTIKVKVE